MSFPSVLPSSRVPDPSEAPPLNWGILAPGRIAHAFATAVSRHTRQKLAAVGSRSRERGAAFAAEFGIERVHDSYEALVNDPAVDLVYVASPHSEHADQALLAIEAGKHVLVEKSFARNAADATVVVDAARRRGVALMEAMWTRFLPRTDIVRQLLHEGVLGEIETVIADHGQWFEFDPTSRLFDPKLAGGALLDLGIYPLSYAVFALGVPQRLTANGTITGTGVDRQVSIILDGFESHRAAQALLSTTLAAKTPTTATISGSLARIELDGDFYAPGGVRLVSRDGSVLETQARAIAGHEGLCYEAAHFAQLVADGYTESPQLPLDETLAIVELLDGARAQLGVSYPGESERHRLQRRRH